MNGSRSNLCVCLVFVVASLTLPVGTARPAPVMDACEAVTMVTRDEWGARKPSNPCPNISVPVNMTFIHHSAGTWSGKNLTECIRQVRSIQNFHMDSRGWSDIAYSFLVCEDGRVYEGRGWTTQGAHTLGYNSVSLGICIIGDYTSRLPDPEALQAAQNLLECGVQKGYITVNYELFGHRDGRLGTECPGDQLYEHIHRWSHFSIRPIHKYGTAKIPGDGKVHAPETAAVAAAAGDGGGSISELNNLVNKPVLEQIL